MFNVAADHSWFGLIEVAFLVIGSGIFSVITAVLGAKFAQRRNADQNAAVDRIEHQVVNSHSDEDNLRDQIDMIRDTVHMIHNQLHEHSRAIRRIESRLENPRRPL